jgi:Cell cycle protein
MRRSADVHEYLSFSADTRDFERVRPPPGTHGETFFPPTSRPPAWLAPLAPLLMGAAVMLAAGAPPGRWALQLISGAAGLLVFFAVRLLPRSSGVPFAAFGVPAALALLAATLLAEGVDGVHRWIQLGPVQLHPSALLAPAVLVVAWRRVADHPRSVLSALAVFQAIHVAQPDAGQATTFGVAALVLLLGRRATLGPRTTTLAAALVVASIAATWIRPDPLGPAPFVEDIVQRAFRLGAPYGVLAVASLIPLVLAPLLGRRAGEGLSPAGSARPVLVVYLVGSLVVVLLGEFPVPVLGFGASPVVGALLGLAVLGRGTGDGAPRRG